MSIIGSWRQRMPVTFSSSRGRGAAKRLGVMSTVAVVIGAGLLSLGVKPTGADTSGSIQGTVTAAGDGAVQGSCVGATLAGTTGPLAGVAVTGSNGTYTISGLDSTKSYYVAFYNGADCTYIGGIPNNYVDQWYPNASLQATATAVLASGPTDINAVMATGGQISGKVTDTSLNPVSGICVTAWVHGIPRRQPGSNGGQTVTDSSTGTYTIEGLNPSDTYDVGFSSQGFGGRGGVVSNYVDQWYPNVSSQAAASPVSVTSGVTTPDINEAMATGT